LASQRRGKQKLGRRLKKLAMLLVLGMALLFCGFLLGAGAVSVWEGFNTLHILLQVGGLIMTSLLLLVRRTGYKALAQKGRTLLPRGQTGSSQAAQVENVVAERRKDAWWPELFLGSAGELRFAAPPSSSESTGTRTTPPISGDGQELLERLLAISSACQKVQPGAKETVGDMNIQRIVQKENCAVWSAQAGNDPVLFVASEVLLTTPEPPEAVLWALYSTEERLSWDSSSFTSYKVVGDRQVQESTKALCDFLYCRIHLVTGVTDRDMVQERFLFRLPDRGYAIAIRACTDEQCSTLGLSPVPGAVRARTVISGYIIRPHPGGQGVVLTGISQTDLGGSVPQWVQGLIKKAGKRKPVEWAQRLEDHCNMRAGLDVASRRLTFSALRNRAKGWTKELAQNPCFPRDGATTRRSRTFSPARSAASYPPVGSHHEH